MNPWASWRIGRIRARVASIECAYPSKGEPCRVAYWNDASGRFDHGRQYGHRPHEGGVE